MSIYTGRVFDMTRTQFGTVADHLKIPADERDRLLYPICRLHNPVASCCSI